MGVLCTERVATTYSLALRACMQPLQGDGLWGKPQRELRLGRVYHKPHHLIDRDSLQIF